MLESKPCNRIKNILGGLICELDVSQECISDTEDVKMQTSRANEQREEMSRIPGHSLVGQ